MREKEHKLGGRRVCRDEAANAKYRRKRGVIVLYLSSKWRCIRMSFVPICITLHVYISFKIYHHDGADLCSWNFNNIIIFMYHHDVFS